MVTAPTEPGLSNIQRMDNTRNVTQDGQTDVDENVGATSALQEDTQRGQDDGEDDLADIAIKESVIVAGAAIVVVVVAVVMIIAMGLLTGLEWDECDEITSLTREKRAREGERGKARLTRQ